MQKLKENSDGFKNAVMFYPNKNFYLYFYRK